MDRGRNTSAIKIFDFNPHLTPHFSLVGVEFPDHVIGPPECFDLSMDFFGESECNTDLTIEDILSKNSIYRNGRIL